MNGSGTRNGPVGVFDSGVGGLSIALEIRRLLPHEDLIYLADTAHFPYGEKAREEIERDSLAAAGLLVRQGVKLIVVACNSASSTALRALRAAYAVPFVGTVPAIKPASAQTHTGKVGVIATRATAHAEAFSDLVEQFAHGNTIMTHESPELVALVESGNVASGRAQQLVREHVDPLLAQGIDILVLGCTHYSLLKDIFQSVAGPGVTILDTGVPVARQVQRVLEAQGLSTENTASGQVRYIVTGDWVRFRDAISRIDAAVPFLDALGGTPERASVPT